MHYGTACARGKNRIAYLNVEAEAFAAVTGKRTPRNRSVFGGQPRNGSVCRGYSALCGVIKKYFDRLVHVSSSYDK
jgi:hypothetical protein